jgi:CheY-like chemotaxis protein
MTSTVSHKVLLVDDEEDILDLLRYNLEREGIVVRTATNGQDALKMAKAERPDLVVLDIMMPGMDGVEVCNELRRTPGLENTLIVFLTARTEDYSHIAGYGQAEMTTSISRSAQSVREQGASAVEAHAQQQTASMVIEANGSAWTWSVSP